MKLVTPTNATKYVLFQRTEYLFFSRSGSALMRAIYRMFVKFFSFNAYVRVESVLFPKRIARLFNEDMYKELLSIKNYLPEHPNNVLDIGCGVGGIDALLYEYYLPSGLDIFLLDKSSVDGEVYYNFAAKGSVYNSLAVAKKLLAVNGVDPQRIHTQEVGDTNSILFGDTFDLVISLISWGFHYPVSTYLDQVYEKMNTGGMLIIDVRKDTDGEESVIKKFGNSRTIIDARKHKRIVSIKQ